MASDGAALRIRSKREQDTREGADRKDARAPELMLGLHCRGYAGVATTATCGLPHGQYGVALVDWEGRSAKARETTLD